MIKVFTFLTVLLVATAGVSAQTEPDSKRHFEATHITLKIDIPATKDGNEPNPSKSRVVELGPRSTYLKEGLNLTVVMRVLGTPTTVSEHIENGKVIRNYEWSRGERRTLSAQFVDDVLVHFQTVETSGPVPRTAGF